MCGVCYICLFYIGNTCDVLLLSQDNLFVNVAKCMPFESIVLFYALVSIHKNNRTIKGWEESIHSRLLSFQKGYICFIIDINNYNWYVGIHVQISHCQCLLKVLSFWNNKFLSTLSTFNIQFPWMSRLYLASQNVQG